jgi:hypothetical protein
MSPKALTPLTLVWVNFQKKKQASELGIEMADMQDI